MRKHRQLNIEFLRIFSMLLITLWHVQCHILYPLHLQSHPMMTYLFLFIPFHVNLFVLITGYFGVHNSTRGIIRSMTLLWFYSISINLIILITGLGQFNLLEALLPLSHSEWWFMQQYIVLLLVAPVIENFISNSSDRTYIILVLSALFVNVYLGFFNQVPGLNFRGYDIINFICVYILGTWIRKYSNYIFTLTSYPRLFLSLAALLLIAFKYKACGWTWIPVSFSDYNSPYCILMAMCIFMFLLRTNISQKARGIIMFFSSSAVATYLITDHPVIRKFLTTYFLKIYENHQTDLYGVAIIILCVIISFIVCSCIDKIRIKLMKSIDEKLSTIVETRIWSK